MLISESNLAHVDLDQVSVYLYLHGVCGWSENQLREYKLDNGYKLFLDRHISQVTVSEKVSISDDFDNTPVLQQRTACMSSL